MAAIEIDHLSKKYGSMPAVKDFSLRIEDHQFVTLLGPSGCGKTTTLRLIAGFLKPDAGTIRAGSQTLSSPQGVVPPERRGMGMVFQNYAVWPHKTVYENVAFGLRVRKVPRQQVQQRMSEVLEMVHLTGLESRYPNQLSGGQQQRVALARSLVVEPDILLLDEPLSNLDAKLRERMRWELKVLQRRTGITFVYVTHDQAEAMALSDRIAVMHLGELQQFDTPREVYTRPANKTVADFMGLVNLVAGRVTRASSSMGEVALGSAAGPRIWMPLPESTRDGDDVELAIRPEFVTLASSPGDSDAAVLPGVVEEAVFLGNIHDYSVSVGDLRLRVQAHPRDVFEVGQPVYVHVDGERCSLVR